MRILVINGPNLNLIGSREPEIYGSTTHQELEDRIVGWASAMSINVETRQTNSESEILDWLHETDADGVIINPGAFSHTSRAIADAIAALDSPVVETHLSNINKREPWRAKSVVSDVCVTSIYGRGIVGYRDALIHLVNRAAMQFREIKYGPHPENVGDLRGDGSHIAVIVHGGLFRGEFTRDTTESIAVDLAQSGWTTWNIEYRRLGGGGGWPGSGHDVLTAFDHVQNLPETYDTVAVIGHSVGSYLSVWAAELTSTPIELSIQLAGIYDLRIAIESGGVAEEDCRTVLEMGAPQSVSPRSIPTLLFHGDSDEIAQVTQSEDLAAKTGATLTKTGSGHFQWLDPSKEEWQLVKSHIPSRT